MKDSPVNGTFAPVSRLTFGLLTVAVSACPRAVAALTKIFPDEIERLLCTAAGVVSDVTTSRIRYVLPRRNAATGLRPQREVH